MQHDSVSQGYDSDFIALVEMIYGKGFLSQGGEESILKMVRDCELKNKKILDIGSGIGGPCIALAKHHDAHITGLEPQKWMVEIARSYQNEVASELKGSLEFSHMPSSKNLRQFADATFDITLSKESLLHIPIEEKAPFFSEIYRVLKPGGQLIIMDWCHSSPGYSENTKKMMELDGVAFNLITPQEYLRIVEKIGFKKVVFEDTTQEHARLSQLNIKTIQALKSLLIERYGKQTYTDSLSSWGWQRDAFHSRELLTHIFRATK